MPRLAVLAVPSLLAAPLPAAAEIELGFYGGAQSAPPSQVTIEDPSRAWPNTDFTATWEGRSFEAPIYYGLRATWWGRGALGFGIDLNHAKVYADEATLAASGLSHLEFSDGLNILTVNAWRRWDPVIGGLQPYLGAGIGVSVPHVEVIDGDSRTWGYQLTGPALTFVAGASYPLSGSWSVFGEYKGTWSWNEAELETGGTLSTDISTNAVNFGISFRF